MRTTLTIDDDVLAAVRSMAQRQGKSVGELISMLTRQALQPQQSHGVERNGVPLLPNGPGAKAVTPALISELLDELP
ncbi:MAG: CopG family transcriptional regulator [Proteobacteria bacterium]|nr:CopG family transcriptional regulator [Pseudomonadota bacterium]